MRTRETFITTFALLLAGVLSACGLTGDRAAVDLTPDPVDYAAEVDRICVVTYSELQARIDAVEQMGPAQGWSDARVEAERLGLSAAQGAQILSAMSELGPPPENPELWARWRHFMAERASLKARASRAAADRRWIFRAYLMNLSYHMKDRQDVLGRQLGLSACASG